MTDRVTRHRYINWAVELDKIARRFSNLAGIPVRIELSESPMTREAICKITALESVHTEVNARVDKLCGQKGRNLDWRPR